MEGGGGGEGRRGRLPSIFSLTREIGAFVQNVGNLCDEKLRLKDPVALVKRFLLVILLVIFNLLLVI